MKYILFLIIVLIPSIGSAQLLYPYGGGTVDSNYFNGQGARASGYGDFLKGLGEYQIDHQQAVKQAIENRGDAFDTQRKIESINKADFAAKHPNMVEQKNKQLDLIEKLNKLRESEDLMIRDGKLPPRPEPSVVIRGHRYNTVAEWKTTTDYKLCLLEQHAKELQDTIHGIRDEEYRRDAVIGLRKWDHMSTIEKERWDRNEKLAQDGYDIDQSKIRSPHGNYPELEDEIKMHTKILMSVYHQIDELRTK